MKTDKRTEKRRIGDMGEGIACDFLTRRGFEVLDRNYLKKWGEIDIVAKKGTVIHFVEVKTVSRVVLDGDLTQETKDKYRPEDNMHPWKLKRLSKVIQTYLLDKKIDSDWQLDLITVQMDHRTRKARVELIENIII